MYTEKQLSKIAKEADVAHDSVVLTPFLMRFAALVAAAEREACARLVGAKIQETQIYSNPSHLVQVAAAISARNNNA